MRRLTMVAVVTAVMVAGLTGRAGAVQIVDQSNAGGLSNVGYAPVLYSPLGQTFIPSLIGIDFVRFNIQNGYSTNQSYNVSLFQGTNFAATPLGTTADVTIPGRFGASDLNGSPVEFSFASRIALTPGSTYSLIVNYVSGTIGGNYVIFTRNTYSNGVGIVEGSQNSDLDAIFSEGITQDLPAVAAPEPSTLAGAGLGIACLAGAALKRRRAKRLAV